MSSMESGSTDLIVRLIDTVQAQGKTVENTVRDLSSQVSQNRQEITELKLENREMQNQLSRLESSDEQILKALNDNSDLLNEIRARDSDRVEQKLPTPIVMAIIGAAFIVIVFFMILATRLLIPGADPLDPSEIPLPPGWGSEEAEG